MVLFQWDGIVKEFNPNGVGVGIGVEPRIGITRYLGDGDALAVGDGGGGFSILVVCDATACHVPFRLT